MADDHHTRERAAWVLARAGRRPAARRRGERLAARARRSARYEAGTGDAGVAEVVTRHRFARISGEHEEHRPRWFILACLIEVSRLVVAGPAIGLSWAVYGVWYRHAPAWGPLRWRWLAAGAGGVAFVALVVGAVLWLGHGVPVWGWWLLAQPAAGVARSAWLAYAYGWDVVPTATAINRPAPIRVQLGQIDPLPTTTPVEPVAPTVRVVVPEAGDQ